MITYFKYNYFFYVISYTGSSTSSFHILNVDLMVPLDFLYKWVSSVILVKVLCYVYTTSCRFSKVVDFQAKWNGLTRSWILQVDPVFLKFEIHLKIEVYRVFPNVKSISSPRGRDGFCFEAYYECSTSAAPKPDSFFQEINHFRETATCSENLGQYFHPNC